MQRLIGLVILIVSVSSHSDQLITLYDSGDTVSLDRYTHRTPRAKATLPLDKIKLPTLPIVFPITTSTLSPGKIEPTAFSLPHLQIPLFLIGSDDLSKQWLQQRHTELERAGAVGLLVNVDSKETYITMTTLAQGLRLIPASATDIAQVLNLHHYPVLISKNGWEQ